MLTVNIYQARWEDLTATERRYLRAAAELTNRSGDAGTGDIAHRLGRTQQQLSTVRAALINQRHILRAARQGESPSTYPALRIGSPPPHCRPM
jgi:hypothetical protein